MTKKLTTNKGISSRSNGGKIDEADFAHEKQILGSTGAVKEATIALNIDDKTNVRTSEVSSGCTKITVLAAGNHALWLMNAAIRARYLILQAPRVTRKDKGIFLNMSGS
jgi:hypothetical protein